jgi:hypothetical protein
MNQDSPSPTGKEILLNSLKVNGIEIVRQEDNKVFTESDFCIEVEGVQLYKLSQDGYIIAPYDNLDELCRMIKMG